MTRDKQDKKVELLSYREFQDNDEFYMYFFKNDKLEKWYSEFKEKTKVN